MCGRYKISTKAPQILAAFDIDVADAYEPAARFNVAPTDSVPVIRMEPKDGPPSSKPAVVVDGAGSAPLVRKLVPLRWGLLPFWAQSAREGARMINARAEGLSSKKFFKESLAHRRCLVVADGFYEWIGEGKNKQPYLLCFEDRHVFAFAGLWSRWHDPANKDVVIESVGIITTPPNEVAAKVHDRMPLVLDPAVDQERISRWLDVAHAVDIQDIGAPRALPGFTAFPVDKRVGNVKNDDATLCVPALDAQPALLT